MPLQTKHGLEYPVLSDSASLVASDPPTDTHGWFEKGWVKLDAAAGHFYVIGTSEELWITTNAVYTGTAWNREDTTKRADAFIIQSTGDIYTARAPAGANPISWTTKRLVLANGEIDPAALQDNSITSSKIAAGAVTRPKVSFPALQTHALTSDTPVTTTWTQILGVNVPEAGRLLITVQQAVRFTGSSTQTFNGSLYIGGAAVDPIVTLRTGETNFTSSQSLTIVHDVGGPTSVTYAVASSADNVFTLLASGTKLFVTYLPGS